MSQRITEYFVRVSGAQKNGHPIQRIEMNFHEAAKAMDQLHAEFPEHDVTMYEATEKEICTFKGKFPEAKCPRGCQGTRDNRAAVIRTQNGMVQCSICGYLG